MESTWEAVPERLRKLGPILTLILVVVIALLIAIALSVVKIDGDEVGIVEKKLFGGNLPDGRVIAVNGENGIQAQLLAPGWHVKWVWQYNVNKIKMIEIKPGFVGLVQAADGRSLPAGTIFAPQWEDKDKMLNAEYFLSQGQGFRGPQLSILPPARYRINTKLFAVTPVPITNVRVGSVAVVKSNVGDVVKSEDRLVEEGQRGIWNKPLTEGEYRLHTKAYEITMISIRQVKVSYTAEREQGEKGNLPD